MMQHLYGSVQGEGLKLEQFFMFDHSFGCFGLKGYLNLVTLRITGRRSSDELPEADKGLK